jgi:RNA polymerase sigma factor (sigma-70 family)
MRPSRTAGHRSDRRDTSVSIATHVYELPVVREEPIEPPDAPPLERMLAAAASGDTSAWAALRRRYAGRLRAVARRHRLGAHDVEDVLQTTWLRLFEHADRIRDPRALGAWLDTTARRESLRILAAAQREEVTDREVAADATHLPECERVTAAERRAALESALTALPPQHQRLMAMLLVEPAPSYAQISRALDMPIGSIGPIRARCLVRLRRNQDLLGVLRDALA